MGRIIRLIDRAYWAASTRTLAAIFATDIGWLMYCMYRYDEYITLYSYHMLPIQHNTHILAYIGGYTAVLRHTLISPSLICMRVHYVHMTCGATYAIPKHYCNEDIIQCIRIPHSPCLCVSLSSHSHSHCMLDWLLAAIIFNGCCNKIRKIFFLSCFFVHKNFLFQISKQS